MSGTGAWAASQPIRAEDRPHLLVLGRLLGTTRRAVGMTQPQLGMFAGLSRVPVARIECGLAGPDEAR